MHISPVGSMAYSDRVVLQAIRELQDQHGPDALLSQRMIGERAEGCERTIRYALKRLMLRGILQGEFTVGIGYRYRIAHEQLTARQPERSPAT